LSFEDGALLEPLSVALAAVERSKLRRGDAVLICGAGPVGLTMLLCAREAGAGAHRLVITDLDAGRLAFAESLAPGRVRTLRVAPEEAPNELAARIAEAMGGTEPDVILECTGEEASIRAAIEVVRSGGAVFVVGIRKSEICYPVKRLLTRKVVLGQQYQYHNTFSEAIRLVEAGVLSDVRKLVTHRFPIEDAVRAFETSADPKSGAIKVQITNS
jgi:L-iditol 2-dehydrogenase